MLRIPALVRVCDARPSDDGTVAGNELPLGEPRERLKSLNDAEFAEVLKA